MDKARRILLVDDESPTRDILDRWLSKEGFACDHASNADQALEHLAQTPFSLAVLDINMPGISGIDLLRKSRHEYPDMAVVMVTGVDSPDVAKTALKLGAYGYIIKPITKNEILINVSHALRLQQLEKENKEYRENLEEKVTRRTAELEKALADLKASQEQLIQQEKLATIGHLAAGVAHEIKNPTGYIGSNLGTMSKYLGRFSEFANLLAKENDDTLSEMRQAKKKLKLDFILEDAQDIIVECLEGVDRIKTIVEGLKAFSRKENDTTRIVNINDCVDNALNVAWNELKYKTKIEKYYGDLLQVEGFSNQLAQVFMNLLVNAAHAIKDKGTITITTCQKDEFVHVSIADTGSGIPESIQATIFEPFFTTKEEGVGTGLGLSIIKEIIARHNGEITLESEEGKGSVFTVSIPASDTLSPPTEDLSS